LGVRSKGISEFKASLVYRVSSRTARATQRNPVTIKLKINQSVNKSINKILEKKELGFYLVQIYGGTLKLHMQ
jgi:ACT domain-containing protein